MMMNSLEEGCYSLIFRDRHQFYGDTSSPVILYIPPSGVEKATDAMSFLVTRVPVADLGLMDTL